MELVDLKQKLLETWERGIQWEAEMEHMLTEDEVGDVHDLMALVSNSGRKHFPPLEVSMPQRIYDFARQGWWIDRKVELLCRSNPNMSGQIADEYFASQRFMTLRRSVGI